MSPTHPFPGDIPPDGQQLATISYGSRFWDVFLEFVQDLRNPDSYRAALAFSPVDRGEHEEAVRTVPVIIESSYEEVFAKARALDDQQLAAFLRSLLP